MAKENTSGQRLATGMKGNTSLTSAKDGVVTTSAVKILSKVNGWEVLWFAAHKNKIH